MRLLTTLTLLLALALPACGGDDDGASPTVSHTAAPTATPSASPTSSPSPAELSEQLSYVGATGGIRLVEADGSGDRVLSEAPCDAGDSVNVKDISMSWAPDGSALAFICGSDVSPRQTLVILDADGKRIAGIPDVSGFRWSPDSARLAYQRSAEPGSVEVGLFEPGTGTERTLRNDAILMEWVGPGSLLLGLEPVFGDMATEFKANLIELASGESTAFPEFDNARALWVSPDGARMIVLTDQRDPDGGGPGMAVYDFARGETTDIKGAYIGYPSEFIPRGQLAFSADGNSIFWANAAATPTSVWQATLDDAEARRLGEVGSLFVAVSPSGRVAALGPEQGDGFGVLFVHDPAAGTRIEAGEGNLPFAWRTAASP